MLFVPLAIRRRQPVVRGLGVPVEPDGDGSRTRGESWRSTTVECAEMGLLLAVVAGELMGVGASGIDMDVGVIEVADLVQ